MSVYAYKARTPDGKPVSGTMNSDTREAAARDLRRSGLFPVEINDSATAGSEPAAAMSMPFKRRAGRQALADFFQQLNELLAAGMPLVRALDLLGSGLRDERMAAVVRSIGADISAGLSLSDAMAKRPGIFAPLFRGMVRAGEGGGGLENSLAEISRFLEEEISLAAKVRSLLAYPVIMAITGFGTMLFFITFVIPRFSAVLEDMGQTLPLLTRMLLGMGGFAAGYGWAVIPAGAGLYFFSRAYSSSPDGRAAAHKFILSLPLAGPVVATLNISRFSRALGLTLRNGVPMLDAIGLALAAVDNERLKQRLSGLADSAKEGKPLSSALKETGVVDEIVVDLARVGEETGRLPEILLQAGARYEKKAFADLQMMATILEPAIIVLVGVMVAVVVLGMMMPILQINLAV